MPKRDAYLKVILEIDRLRGQPFAPHEIRGMSDTTKRRVLDTFILLKMVARYPRGYNYKCYQTTKKWTDAVEATQLFELTQTIRKPYGHKESHDNGKHFVPRNT